MTVGRRADVVIDSGRVSRLHAALTRLEDGTWDVVDLRSAGGTWVNRQRVASSSDEMTRGTVLKSGDRLDPLELVFRHAFVPEAEHSEQLDEHAASPAAWTVWIDSLLERNHPLGLWMRSPPDDADSRTAFIGAFTTAGDDAAHARWNRFGFVETLTLREEAFFGRPIFGLPARAPGLQYLTQLQLSVREESAERAGEVLRSIPLPRSLRRIEAFSPRSPVYPRWREVLGLLRARLPFLEV